MKYICIKCDTRKDVETLGSMFIKFMEYGVTDYKHLLLQYLRKSRNREYFLIFTLPGDTEYCVTMVRFGAVLRANLSIIPMKSFIRENNVFILQNLPMRTNFDVEKAIKTLKWTEKDE